MVEVSTLVKVFGYVFDALGVILGILSFLLLLKKDRNAPYREARLKSVKRALICAFFAFLFIILAPGSEKTGNLDTTIFCIFGWALTLFISYGIAYLQFKYLGKSDRNGKK
jgi:hypothetical protein